MFRWLIVLVALVAASCASRHELAKCEGSADRLEFQSLGTDTG